MATLAQAIAGLAVTFAAVSPVAPAAGEGTGGRFLSAGWLPVVIIALWPGPLTRPVTRTTGAHIQRFRFTSPRQAGMWLTGLHR